MNLQLCFKLLSTSRGEGDPLNWELVDNFITMALDRTTAVNPKLLIPLVDGLHSHISFY